MVSKFSHGFRKDYDGLWRPLDPGSVRRQYQPIVDTLKKIDIGSCTGIIDTDDRFFIAKLIDRKQAKIVPFSQAQAEIKRILLQQRWQIYRQKCIADSLKKASIGNSEQFIKDTTIAAYEQLKKSR